MYEFLEIADVKLLQVIEEAVARKYNSIAFSYVNNKFLIAVPLGTAIFMDKKFIKYLEDRNIDYNFVEFSKEEIERAINTYYSIILRNKEIQEKIGKLSLENNVDSLWNLLVVKGIDYDASDIHIAYMKTYIIIKFRMAGGLKTFCILDQKIGEGLIRIIKLNSSIEVSRVIGNREGRILFKQENESLDMRVSIVRTLDKEKVHIRLLRFDNVPKRLQQLGIGANELRILHKFTRLDNGFLVVCGPTGSGKSTTLRCLLSELDNGERHIVSVEDPIEYTIENVTQIQVNEANDFGFEKALRSILRIDPDVIYLGELRDMVSAEVATSAAITGHLVLSTLHTKSASSAIDRLKDLGIDNYSIANSLSLVVNQRLIRILCEECKEVDPWNEGYYRRIGCHMCNYTGISHRKPLLEFLVIGRKERIALLKGESLKDGNVINQLKNQVEELLKLGKISFEEGGGFLNE